MSNSRELFGKIQESLLQYALLIEQSNRLNLTDEANHAEDLFARLLGVVFSAKYQSTNLSVANFQTIDLFDTDKSECIQITSNQNYKTKKDKTVEGFALPKFKKFKSLIILFITSK